MPKKTKNGEWALPGGIVEAGQTIAETRTRELIEEAVSYMNDGDEKSVEKERVSDIFSRNFDPASETDDCVLYRGVVDDPRNTDKSWMETVAMLTVLKGSDANLRLKEGDDAGKANWKDYPSDVPLYASHENFLFEAVSKLQQMGYIDANNRVTPLGETIADNRA